MKQTFRNLSFFAIAITFLATSCGEKNEQVDTTDFTNEINSLKAENDSLQQIAAQKDSAIAHFTQYFTDIQNNLSQIQEKEKSILMKSQDPEFQNKSNADLLKQDLEALGALLVDNKKKIAGLKSKLKDANLQLDEFEGAILSLNQQIENKDREIMSLRNELGDLGVAFDELLAAYENNVAIIAENNQTIQAQKEKLNEAYYTFGTRKELKNNNVIDKEGGVIGLGGVSKLKDNFNHDYFTQIDITKTNEIPLGVKKAEILTNHPAGSFEFIGNNNIEKLVIKDAEKFWSVSKYLVVEVK